MSAYETLLLSAVVILLFSLEAARGACFEDIINDTCPLMWRDAPECSCGDSLGGAVMCDPVKNSTQVLQGYCMTYGQDTLNQTLNVGRCSLNSNSNSSLYRYVHPRYSMCEVFKKTGFMCSLCQDDNCLSYTLDDYGRCIPCSPSPEAWLSFLALQLLPPTLIYFFILFSRVRVSAPHLNMVIFFCQMVAYPRPSNIMTVHAILNDNYQSYLFVLYNLFNLKLTSPAVQKIGITGLTFFVASLANYAVCLYVLALASVVYGIVVLHERGFKPVVFCLRPLHKCITVVHGPWRVSGTFMDVFVTMLVIMYWRLATTALAVLSPTTTYDSSGKETGKWHYFNASLRYFDIFHAHSENQMPFAVDFISVLVLFLLLLPPVFLAFNQFRFFHSFLNRFSHRRSFRTFQLYVKIFSDNLQSRYKDGTNGTGDYRYFASFYFLIRLVGAYIYYTQPLWSSPALAIIFLGLLVLVCFFQPYKNPLYNAIDAAVFGAFVLMNVLHTALEMLWALANEYDPQHGDTMEAMVTFKALVTILISLPVLYFALCIFYQLVLRSRAVRNARASLERRRQLRAAPPINVEWSASTEVSDDRRGFHESLADRLRNPEGYQSLKRTEHELMSNPSHTA